MSYTEELTVEELRILGNEKFRALNYGAALMRYTQALDKDPSNFAVYYNRAVTFVKMDAIDEAKEDLLKSLEINPNYIPSLCQLGFIYLYKGDTPSSLETYAKIIKLNQTLPNQMNRFKAQLKKAIQLAEDRCRQQEYPESFINEILTPEIREIINSYPDLPNNMVESGVPPVAFGNVPISNQTPQAAIISRTSIPIPAPIPTEGNTRTQVETSVGEIGENIARALNIPGLTNLFNGQGVATFNVGNPDDFNNLMAGISGVAATPTRNDTPRPPPSGLGTARRNSTSQSAPDVPVTQTRGAEGTTTQETASQVSGEGENHNEVHRPTIVSVATTTTPVVASSLPIPEHVANIHNMAVQRARELREQRDAGRAGGHVSTPAPPETSNSVSSDATSVMDSDAEVPDPEVEVPEEPANTPQGTATDSNPAFSIARTMQEQLMNAIQTNAARGNLSTQSLAQNLGNIASTVIGGLASSALNTQTNNTQSSNTQSSNTQSGNTQTSSTNASNSHPDDLEVDMDLD